MSTEPKVDICPWCHAPDVEHGWKNLVQHARKYREKLWPKK